MRLQIKKLPTGIHLDKNNFKAMVHILDTAFPFGCKPLACPWGSLEPTVSLLFDFPEKFQHLTKGNELEARVLLK
jgi:hypothetical protein